VNETWKELREPTTRRTLLPSWTTVNNKICLSQFRHIRKQRKRPIRNFGRRLLDLDEYAYVESGQQTVVDLSAFGKESTRPQHFSHADTTFANALKVQKFDRKAKLKGQYGFESQHNR